MRHQKGVVRARTNGDHQSPLNARVMDGSTGILVFEIPGASGKIESFVAGYG